MLLNVKALHRCIALHSLHCKPVPVRLCNELGAGVGASIPLSPARDGPHDVEWFSAGHDRLWQRGVRRVEGQIF